jgi:hypothetical protein
VTGDSLKERAAKALKFINDNAGTIVAILAAAAAFGSWYEAHMTRKSQDSLVEEQIMSDVSNVLSTS